MRAINRQVVVGLMLAFAVGCSRPAPSPPNGGSASVPVARDLQEKTPLFQSELVHAHSINGSSGSGTHRSTRYDSGKPFTTVGEYSTILQEGATTLKYDLAFTAHRDGKDVYKLSYTVTTPEGAETKCSDIAYDGNRTVVVEDEYGSLVLQPPSN